MTAGAERAAALCEQGRPASALAELDAVLAARPHARRARYWRAVALVDLFRPGEAVADLDAVLADGAGKPQWVFRRAVALDALGEADRAEADLRRVLAAQPGHVHAAWRLGRLLVRRAAFTEANELLGPFHGHAWARWILGRALLGSGGSHPDYDGPTLEQLRRFDDPASVVIATEPKSGTHWLRFLLANYLRLLADPRAADPLTLADLAELGLVANQRWFCLTGREPVIEPSAFLAELGIGEISWQHVGDRHDLLEGCGARRVLARRHPLDQLVSRWHYNYAQRSIENRRDDLGPVSDIAEIAERELVSIAGHRRSTLAARHDPATVATVEYEQLQADPAGEFTALVAALDLPVDHELIGRAVERSDFAVIHAQEAAAGPIYDHITGFFTRDGSSGQYRRELSVDQIEWAVDLLARLGVDVPAQRR